jgi:hypothetical protein
MTVIMGNNVLITEQEPEVLHQVPMKLFELA